MWYDSHVSHNIDSIKRFLIDWMDVGRVKEPLVHEETVAQEGASCAFSRCVFILSYHRWTGHGSVCVACLILVRFV